MSADQEKKYIQKIIGSSRTFYFKYPIKVFLHDCLCSVFRALATMGNQISGTSQDIAYDYSQVKRSPRRPRNVHKRYIVLYNPLAVATPIFEWCHRNRPTSLPSSYVDCVVVRSELYQKMWEASHYRSKSGSPGFPHVEPGVWVFTLRDCCLSVDYVWRHLAYGIANGSLRNVLQLVASSNCPNHGGWYVIHVFTRDWDDTESALAVEEAIRTRGVRNDLAYYHHNDPTPLYLSHYDEDNDLIMVDKVPVHGGNSFERIKQFHCNATIERKRCRECTRHVAPEDLLDPEFPHRNNDSPIPDDYI